MGIQSTVELTRKQAETKLMRLLMERVARIWTMTDDEICELLDETFYNYSIRANPNNRHLADRDDIFIPKVD